jgi:hypothetical protein
MDGLDEAIQKGMQMKIGLGKSGKSLNCRYIPGTAS